MIPLIAITGDQLVRLATNVKKGQRAAVHMAKKTAWQIPILRGEDRALYGQGVRISAERLLNNELQMRMFDANERAVMLTKQTKIGRCEQVRVN
jgi:hypothetical protein